MNPDPAAPLTELLRRSAGGDAAARDQVWDQLHAQLRLVARGRLARDRAANCRPTELVHEAFLKLADCELAPRDRNHFLALAARAMRQVLIDQARARQRHKRGDGLAPLTLDSRALGPADEAGTPIDVLDLHAAIDALAEVDARKAEAVVLSYFGGLTDEEVAGALEIAPATAKRDLRMARAWLASALEPS